MKTQTRDTQSRGWMLTIPADPHPGGYKLEEVEEILSSYRWVGQKEQGGKTGYTHFQVYVENKNPIKFSTLQSKLPRCHFEKRQGSKIQAWDYCTKEESRVSGPYGNLDRDELEKGTRNRGEILSDFRNQISSGEKTLSDLIVEDQQVSQHIRYLERYEQEIRKNKAKQGFREIETHILYGEPGVGKTKRVYDLHGYDDVYSPTTYSHPFDAYNGENVLLLDEYVGQLEIEYLLKLLDGYPVQLAARYMDKWAAFTSVYVISNAPLEAMYPDIYRSHPRQWNALMRRVSTYNEMVPGGELIQREKPLR